CFSSDREALGPRGLRAHRVDDLVEVLRPALDEDLVVDVADDRVSTLGEFDEGGAEDVASDGLRDVLGEAAAVGVDAGPVAPRVAEEQPPARAVRPPPGLPGDAVVGDRAAGREPEVPVPAL